ncbi:DUF1616 domain-containing protein [Chloroflexota bacterium]
MTNRGISQLLSAILILAVVAAIAALAYIITTPAMKAKFTEFYILDLEGKAQDYPNRLKPDEEGSVIMAIVNHEQKLMSYRVEVVVDGTRQTEIGPVLLENEEKWEQEVSFTPVRTGRLKVEFLLYTFAGYDGYFITAISPKPVHLFIYEGEDTIFKEALHLWIDGAP